MDLLKIYKESKMKSKKTIFISIAVVLFISLTGYIISESKVPKGWLLTGSSPGSYEVGVDKKAMEKGGNSVYLKSIEENISGFGTLMQNFSADNYLNKRVRFSGSVRSKNVVGTAGLWMRVDGKEDPTKPLAFDNMNDRPITGTTEWKKYDVVLDVPAKSSLINIGILLAGSGEVWLSNIKVEIVDRTVPTTGSAKAADEPVNLNFEN